MKIRYKKTRIITGIYNSRYIKNIYDAKNGLRVTTSRTRKTLVSWLFPYIKKSVCLDGYAGSGILGIEAISNMANFCLFIDINKQALKIINENINILNININSYKIMRTNIIQYLKKPITKMFDIIFLDPPFKSNLAEKSLYYIYLNKSISNNTLIYIEIPSILILKSLKYFNVIKYKNIGNVSVFLLRKIKVI